MIVENQNLKLNPMNIEGLKIDSARAFSFELELPDFEGVISEMQEDEELIKMLDTPQTQAAEQVAAAGLIDAKKNLMKSLQELAKLDEVPVRMENINDIRLFINQREFFGVNGEQRMSLDSMTKDDIEFFKLCTDKNEITVNDINTKDSLVNLMLVDNTNQVSYKSFNFSKGLFNLIDYSFKKQKPVRLDFNGNSSVILKVNNKGGLIAEFISNSAAMEHILRNSIPNLKQKFDSEGIAYEKIFYRENSDKNNKKNKGDK